MVHPAKRLLVGNDPIQTNAVIVGERKKKRKKERKKEEIILRTSDLNQLIPSLRCHINTRYLDRQDCANRVDPDQTPQDAASDQGLHCLPLIQQLKTHLKVVK